MNSSHVADQVWREHEFTFVSAFVMSCELIRLGWQESGCTLSQPGLLCLEAVSAATNLAAATQRTEELEHSTQVSN